MYSNIVLSCLKNIFKVILRQKYSLVKLLPTLAKDTRQRKFAYCCCGVILANKGFKGYVESLERESPLFRGFSTRWDG